MTKGLHTFIALRDGVKGESHEKLTAVHRASTKRELYEGLTRTYRPKLEDGDQLPSENKNVQLTSADVLTGLVDAVARRWNLTATVDAGNQEAVADVVVPTGEVTPSGEPVVRRLLTNVPSTFLLYLARELDDIHKFVKELPTLDPGVAWRYDESVDAHVSDPVETHRTQKVMRNHVLYEATDRHPAQVQTFTEDVVVGYWTSVRRSTALPQERKTELLRRVQTLRLAVKEARERANLTQVDDVEVARQVFDYLLGE